MKLLKNHGSLWQYELQDIEAVVLESLLKQYPFTNLTPVKISNGKMKSEDLDREILLNESLAAHRNELKQIAVNLAKECLSRQKDKWFLTLKPDSKEILLQILNDIRVGIWKELGESEDIHEPPKDSMQKLKLWQCMQLSGYFEEMLVGVSG